LARPTRSSTSTRSTNRLRQSALLSNSTNCLYVSF
jgi:hypothetical protein